MKAYDFLNENLEKLSNHFPSINMKYGYNSLIKTHIVVVAPDNDFYNNTEFDYSWVPLSFKFKRLFPDEEIAFVPASSPLANIKVLLEYNYLNIDAEALICFYSEFSETEMKYTFPNSITFSATNISKTIHNSLAMLGYPEQLFDSQQSDGIYQSAA